ncbi:MAG: hypothetical protein KDE35_02295 [Geminicoccaceae bacterium]|nr:hypothetical protein [Geminicoccaceae bacterium]
MKEEDDEPPPFRPARAFTRPSMPTDERLRSLGARLRSLLREQEEKPFIADERLQKATAGRLDRLVAPPARGPLHAELEACVVDWRADDATLSTHLLVLLPPCDQEDVVGGWARAQGHDVLSPPDRTTLRARLGAGAAPLEPIDLDGDGILVVPQLERWFLRERRGLDHVRALLTALESVERRCVVGCSSWAWAFLSMATGADMVLPEGVTFQAFDGDRLRRWFAALARDGMAEGVRFRLPKTGADVLRPEGDDRAGSDFLQKLAARSHGIPWVAWHMWRRGLRSDREALVDGEAASGDGDERDRAAALADDAGDRETLWVAAPDEPVVPARETQNALLVLHALLIHEELTVEELRLVLPIVGPSHVVAALVGAGFVERHEGALRCRPAAYPAIRGALEAAGFPMGRF